MYWMLLRSFKNDKHGIISKVHFEYIYMLLLLLFFKNVGTLCVKMTIKKIEKTWWNHNARSRKS